MGLCCRGRCQRRAARGTASGLLCGALSSGGGRGPSEGSLTSRGTSGCHSGAQAARGLQGGAAPGRGPQRGGPGVVGAAPRAPACTLSCRHEELDRLARERDAALAAVKDAHAEQLQALEARVRGLQAHCEALELQLRKAEWRRADSAREQDAAADRWACGPGPPCAPGLAWPRPAAAAAAPALSPPSSCGSVQFTCVCARGAVVRLSVGKDAALRHLAGLECAAHPRRWVTSRRHLVPGTLLS